MTLAQLRTQFRIYVFDVSSDAYTDAQAKSLINEAMHYVANVVSAVQPQLLVVDYTGTVSNAGSSLYVIQDISAQTYPNCRRIVRAEVTGLSSPQETTLQVIDFKDVDKNRGTAATMKTRPPIFLYNTSFGFVQPQDSLAVRVTYLHGLNAMTADTDTPGQVGGSGTANKLPIEWHDLIAMRAALVAMTSDRRDTAELRNMFMETRQALVDAVIDRRKGTEG